MKSSRFSSMFLASALLSLGTLAAPVAAQAQTLKPFDHAFVIVMENHGTNTIIGDPSMPYVTHLAHTYGYADNYFGVTHPSMPNYIAMTSGSNYYSHSDDPSQTFSHANLFTEMDAANLTWKGYMGGLPYAGFTGAQYPQNSKNPLYVNKHDPMVLYPQIKNDPQLMQNVVPLKQIYTELPGVDRQLRHLCHLGRNDLHGQQGNRRLGFRQRRTR